MKQIVRVLSLVAVFLILPLMCRAQMNLSAGAAKQALLKKQPLEQTEEVKKNVLSLPESVRVIESEAFAGTGISSVHLKDGITEIQERAFADTYSLEVVNFPDSLHIIGDNVFSGSQHVKIVGTKGRSVQAYARRLRVPFLPLKSDEQTVIRQENRIIAGKILSYRKDLRYGRAVLIQSRRTGRNLFETRSLDRHHRIELHPLDNIFP